MWTSVDNPVSASRFNANRQCARVEIACGRTGEPSRSHLPHAIGARTTLSPSCVHAPNVSRTRNSHVECLSITDAALRVGVDKYSGIHTRCGTTVHSTGVASLTCFSLARRQANHATDLERRAEFRTREHPGPAPLGDPRRRTRELSAAAQHR